MVAVGAWPLRSPPARLADPAQALCSCLAFALIALAIMPGGQAIASAHDAGRPGGAEFAPANHEAPESREPSQRMAPTDVPAGFIELARAGRGRLYWYGHAIEAPFIVETDSLAQRLWLRVDHAPGFIGLGLVRVPIPVRFRQPWEDFKLSEERVAVLRERYRVDSIAASRYREAHAAGQSIESAIDARIKAYLSFPHLVAEAKRNTARSWFVAWRGDSIEERSYYSISDHVRPAPLDLRRQAASELTAALERGGIVLYSRTGGMTTILPRDSARVRLQVDLVLEGNEQPAARQLLPDLVPELRAGVADIRRLLAEDRR